MQFTKLRISGFKSFVDHTELVIEPGMTGIVGPNGCGKSNLVEALRWAMGETSAKKMRGEDMDDVIFGGTATRPARNLCEVVLHLDNPNLTAGTPGVKPESDQTEMEISRKLERGSGSDYRINGRPARARDVQLLLADNASGAHSPALVSQGRVGALINAKPGDRRQLLEEAAGITGLHSRRHEAELKLKAAETNLTRLDDVVVTMDAQLQNLRKQARQAARYRSISDHIRRAEALLLHLRWTTATAQVMQARGGFDTAEEAVRGLMLAVTQATTRRTDLAASLPPKRQAEAEAAAALQRLLVAREQLDAEERRATEALAALQRRLAQIEGDLAREKDLAADADRALARLAEERQAIADAQADESENQEMAQAKLEEIRDAVAALDAELAAATERLAADEAKRGQIQRQAQDLEQRVATIHRRIEEHQAQKAELERQQAARDDVAEAEEAIHLAEERLELAKATAEEAEAAKATAEQAANAARALGTQEQAAARDALQRAEGDRARLVAEADAITRLLKAGAGDLFPPLVDALTVAKGYEQALAAALGDALTAPLDEAAPVHWRALPALAQVAALPAGAEPLGARVKAPAALDRCLAHVGIVADSATGARLAPDLAPGQILVTREGAAWRWDGHCIAAGTPTAAAERLRQRNRLSELTQEIAEADAIVAEARAAHEAVKDAAEERVTLALRAVDQASSKDRAARDAVSGAFRAVADARAAHARVAQAAAAVASRLAALAESLDQMAADQEDLRERWAEARATLEELPPPGEGREQIAETRLRLVEARGSQAETQNALDRLLREAEDRHRRLDGITHEETSWRQRRDGTGGRLAELTERAEETREERERLAERPAEIEEERLTLADLIHEAQRVRARAGDDLAEAEGQLTAAERTLKEAENGLADAREARAHAEAAVGSAQQHLETVKERIAERLDCPPDQVLALAGLDEGEPLPEAHAVEQRLGRLESERDNMGPVNLRAEQEVQELDEQITVMKTEREDLVSAIARLRQGISGLNKEARERLLAAFHKVDGHFQEMFTQLFGGGRAQLKLTDTEDPLDAGLEIYASPPGKKLQILSLLSGGEQALTAIALLFAVFLCNPAPICVLDEVDAPLDEANVGRFCDLVEEMARAGHTRFLIISHHRLTMSRMDRLFGVTMAERGVSQLVSVDLATAEELQAAE
ncbi:chromosome segregation protein SMC [Azospirillum sp. B4]|uniref:chromosome segregation protein SMC n=1 Tax=Azospirillum sp. B4 TaxID=95605 RepID=UPI0003451BE9|nr:chromosome segregation protein SMC [Azospirillum sp. B4]